MGLDAISIAATIALASTALVFVAIKSLQLAAMPARSRKRFGNTIMTEAAQRFRDRWERLSRDQYLFVSLSLMFVVTFCIAAFLQPQQTIGTLPAWQNVLMLLAVGAAAGYGTWRFAKIILERRRIAFVRDANIAVGHSLLRLTANQMRVFHEVRVPAGVIDNVVVGLAGIYAVDVVAVRPGKENEIELDKNLLRFGTGKDDVSVADSATRASQLGSALKKLVGHPVRVRPVIAVPGWEISAQASEQFLLVNERNLAMLRGWKDEKDYLMNEDVEAINRFLTDQGLRK